ncbi:hypothetical protein [Chitinophaga pinensis]|uniref:Ig-like domain-containing protein n=1 Tax=Chitinophaga pinensis TaxID=79329 RepID=A0A5C6LNS2_9BACT|nr:hypothetical protein [Chitinophaga pinensis]TWV96313.1 hypothetical protein FEF09_23390 [Chitinophaga pinensis]
MPLLLPVRLLREVVVRLLISGRAVQIIPRLLIAGATGLSYDPPAAGATTYYRRQVTSGACSNASTSNVVTITIQSALTAGAIAASQEFCVSGDPVAFTQTTAPTGGGGTYTYQWQSSVTSASTGFTDISGATAAAYDAAVINQTTYYRRITRSGVCPDMIIMC